MELGHRGSCRQLATYMALALRACGIPSTIDRAIWANRSNGHEWNVIIQKDGKAFPFDALDRKRLIFVYKPAKIFRKTFSNAVSVPDTKEIPSGMVVPDEKDVTNEYVKSYDVTIPVNYPNDRYKSYKYAVICTFDNSGWMPVFWGEITSAKALFKNMASGVAYMAAFYDGLRITPASEPFLLRTDGKAEKCRANHTELTEMQLERKYPLFSHVSGFSRSLVDATVEASNDKDFRNSTIFFTIGVRSQNITDSMVNNSQKFRYIRWNTSSATEGNLAEVEFYGKRSPKDSEEKLSGEIIGSLAERNYLNSYKEAMDGNLETWFQKPKKAEGWVGLDLGESNEQILTRVRYCPRSDTNFILQGDTYELFYWENGKWQSLGKKVAEQYNSIAYDNVPSGTIYLLRDRTRGREERIFTYENGKQVWW